MKIDVSTIDGYSEMTPEQKIAYFESFEYDDKSKELTTAHEAIKKLTSENAEKTRQLREKMSEAEKKAEADKEFTSQYEDILKELENYKLKDTLISNGFSSEEVKLLVENNCSPEIYAKIFAKREEVLKKSIGLKKVKESVVKSNGADSDDSGEKVSIGKMLAKEVGGKPSQKGIDKYKIN